MGASRLLVSGSSQYLVKTSLSPSFDTASEFTVCAWVKFTNLTSTGYIISLPEDTTGANGIDIRQASGNVTCDVVCDPNASLGDVSIAIPDTTGFHFVALRGKADAFPPSSDLRLTLNDTNADFNFTAATMDVKAAANELNIGRFGNFGLYWDGKVAYVQGWTRALSDDELNEARWKPGSITTNLAFCIPIFGIQSPEPDWSGNGNSLTATNSPAEDSQGPPVMFDPPIWAYPKVAAAAAPRRNFFAARR